MPDDAFNGYYRGIVETLKSMHREGKLIDSLTVDDALQASRKQYKSSDLSDMAIRALSLNFEGDKQLLMDDYRRRQVNGAVNGLRMMLADHIPPDEVIGKGIETLSGLLQPAEAGAQDLENVIREVIYELQAGKSIPSMATGFADVDSALGGGLRAKTLTIVAGRTSMGKSAFALQIACNAARAGYKVLYFSIEMPVRALSRRVLSMTENLESVELRSPGPNSKNKDWEGVLKRLNIGGPNLVVDDDPGLTSGQAIARAHKVKAQHGLHVVILDYVQLMGDVLGASENRNQLLGRITRAFAVLARRLNVAVVLVSQLNRRLENTADNEPRLSDLRDSGELEQISDNVLMIHRPAYFKRAEDEHKAVLIVGKQREGPTGRIALYWDSTRVRFCNAARGA